MTDALDKCKTGWKKPKKRYSGKWDAPFESIDPFEFEDFWDSLPTSYRELNQLRDFILELEEREEGTTHNKSTIRPISQTT
jgi:hypothetical protein